MTKEQVAKVLESDWKTEMEAFMNEAFVATVAFPTSRRLVTEVFTTSQRVHEAAQLRGHMTGTPVSLETGYDLTKASDQERALQQLDEEDPFFLVLAFPCGFWSPLMNLNGPKNYKQKLKEALALVKFAFKMAERQLARGRHVVLENPFGSRAWKLPWVIRKLKELNLKLVKFDQCRFNLRSLNGFLHKKPTYFATSSQAVYSKFVDKKCRRNHVHDLVFGGQKTTRRAGLYTLTMARAMVEAMEEQFEMDGRREVEVLVHEAMTAGDGDDAASDVPIEDEVGGEGVQFIAEDSDSEVELKDEDEIKVSAAVKQAVKRIHESTGHRSNKRLARALAISHAPPEVILAAKHLKCDVCDERRQPKTRRPASLPVPKDTSDQCHIDLLVVNDAAENKYVICHITDFTSRYQMAGILKSKATAEVVSFLKQHWLPLMGPPRVLVADHGREFISHEFESFCAGLGIYVFYSGIGAPWQNGIAERSGGVLKALLGAIITAHTVVGEREMRDALGEAVMSYNCDVNDSGYSPIQAVTGRQPRMHGDVLGGIQQRLSEHSLISASPSMARTLAMRETAKLAMVRLHFSRGLRKAEMSRSRNPTMQDLPSPGEIVYFYRFQKYQGKNQSKKVLALRKWHGPALLLAIEGHSIAFVSYKGQLQRCALEHIRRASSLEQISAGSWHEAITEVIEQALREQVDREKTKVGKMIGDKQREGEGTVEEVRENVERPQGDVAAEGEDLPPVDPAEVIAAVQPLESVDYGGVEFSRRTSLLSENDGSKVLRSRSPVPELIRRSSQASSRLEPVLDRAREVDERSTGTKRSAEAPVEQLRCEAEGSQEGAILASGEGVGPLQEAMTLTREDVVNMAYEKNAAAHPLIQVQALAALDREDPEQAVVGDHGSWDGRWPLPTELQWKLRERLGMRWPCGKEEFDVEAVEAARKELLWSQMKADEKGQFRKAAEKGWSVYADNGAVEVLDKETSQKILRGMSKEEQQGKVLVPRFVFTDKNTGPRTKANPLPLLANARVVVPGYRDMASFELRRDAPTCCRTSQHLLLSLVACYYATGWRLMSCDIKSAFMKGDPYMSGTRDLYIQNTKGPSDYPRLPFPEGCIARVLKGVFGLSDAPRQWYLRLCRALHERGWERSPMDHACWMLWKPNRDGLHGLVLSHVDDLLVGGDETARNSVLALEKELGFGSVEHGSFRYCGKQIEPHEDGVITVTMKEYHSNLEPVRVSRERRAKPEDDLQPHEQKQLRAILGSLQWLVAQVRLDMGYHLSVLQGEKAKVATLLRANALVKRFKEHSSFGLTFRPMDLTGAGILVVTDASLGNVDRNGGSSGDPSVRVHSQACYFVLLAERALIDGKPGKFCVLDGRSHRLARVCRSTFAAELLGTEEAMDVGHFVRGFVASVLDYPLMSRTVEDSLQSIPLTVVTDAKDVYDKSTSDTPSYGAQKSLAFSIAWLRGMLSQGNTSIRWTSAENMFVDAGTKDMDVEHMHRVLNGGRWCARYTASFIKQTSKGQKKTPKPLESEPVLVGEPISNDDPVLSHLNRMSEQAGWHDHEKMAIHVAKNAKSFRTPFPRFDAKTFPIRSSYGRIDYANGHREWRRLEDKINFMDLQNPQHLIGGSVHVLITIFQSVAVESTKEKYQL